MREGRTRISAATRLAPLCHMPGAGASISVNINGYAGSSACLLLQLGASRLGSAWTMGGALVAWAQRARRIPSRTRLSEPLRGRTVDYQCLIFDGNLKDNANPFRCCRCILYVGIAKYFSWLHQHDVFPREPDRMTTWKCHGWHLVNRVHALIVSCTYQYPVCFGSCSQPHRPSRIRNERLLAVLHGMPWAERQEQAPDRGYRRAPHCGCSISAPIGL